MTKTEQLDDLFKKWENKIDDYNGKFVSDGIIYEEEYDKVNKKILFITKEPNDPFRKEKWDFREICKVKAEFKNNFTYRIAEWSYGILNDFPPYDNLDATELFKTIQRLTQEIKLS